MSSKSSLEAARCDPDLFEGEGLFETLLKATAGSFSSGFDRIILLNLSLIRHSRLPGYLELDHSLQLAAGFRENTS